MPDAWFDPNRIQDQDQKQDQDRHQLRQPNPWRRPNGNGLPSSPTRCRFVGIVPGLRFRDKNETSGKTNRSRRFRSRCPWKRMLITPCPNRASGSHPWKPSTRIVRPRQGQHQHQHQHQRQGLDGRLREVKPLQSTATRRQRQRQRLRKMLKPNSSYPEARLSPSVKKSRWSSRLLPCRSQDRPALPMRFPQKLNK